MEQIAIQKQLTLSDILRTYGKQFIQIRGMYSNRDKGRCAIGVLSSWFGWDGQDKDERTVGGYDEKIYELLGSDGWEKMAKIIGMNDEGKTFEEIADWIDTNNS